MDRPLSHVMTRNNSLVILAGRFRPDGSNTPPVELFNDFGGLAFTVVKTGTGKYAVTTTDGFAGVVLSWFQFVASDIKAFLRKPGKDTIDSTTNQVTSVVEVMVSNGSGDFAAANVSAASDHWIEFGMILIGSSVLP